MNDIIVFLIVGFAFWFGIFLGIGFGKLSKNEELERLKFHVEKSTVEIYKKQRKELEENYEKLFKLVGEINEQV